MWVATTFRFASKAPTVGLVRQGLTVPLLPKTHWSLVDKANPITKQAQK